jgi:uncharacterized integral membrane protein
VQAILMRKFFTALIVVPLALILIVFAVANRHFVTVSFDPFNSTNPSLSASMPLFVLIILAAIIGVLAGGCATWFGQRHWRRAARRLEADARAAREQLAALHGNGMGSLGGPQRLPYPSHGGTAARDKQGATL